MNFTLRKSHRLPMIFQSEINECGLACLAMIASFRGKQIDVRTLRRGLRLSAMGASVRHLQEAAEQLQFRSRSLKLELNEISKLKLPVILHWDLDHFVVLNKIGGRSVLIHDPAIGIRRYSFGELSDHFSGVAIELTAKPDFESISKSRGLSLSDLVVPGRELKAEMLKVFLFSLFLQFFALLTPLYLQLVIDQGIVKGDRELVLLLSILFLFVALVKIAISYFRGKFLLQFSNTLGFAMQSNVFAHLLYLPVKFFQQREIGDIVTRFSSIDKIRQILTQEMITAIVDGLFSLATLALLYLYSPLLTTLAVIATAVYSLIRLIALPQERENRREVLMANAREQSSFIENVHNIGIIKNYNIEQERVSDWQRVHSNSINCGYTLSHFQLTVVSSQSLIIGVDSIVTIYLGSTLCFAGEMSLGQLMSFVLLKQHFSNSISAMLPKLSELKLLKLEFERVAEIVCEPVEEKEACSLVKRNFNNNIRVDRLSFSYPPHDTRVLSGVCFQLQMGECLAIEGTSGSGKSTLLKLLLGMEKPDDGEIFIDGLGRTAFGIGAFKNQVSAIFHNDGLLTGDLAYNITLGVDEGNGHRFELAVEQAGIKEFIDGLPLAFSTQVGSLGSVLSAGQVQRLLLARALYRQPKLLVLDEALSNLDREAAESLLIKLKEAKITIVLVTHNPVLLKFADKRINLSRDEQSSDSAVGNSYADA